MTGQSLGHYRIHERIGRGGMGEVYRATDTTLVRDVALNTLRAHKPLNAEVRVG
jgi:serine/threonine protein kinase